MARKCDNCGKRTLEIGEASALDCCAGSCLRPVDSVALKATRIVAALAAVTRSEALCRPGGYSEVKGEDLFRVQDYLNIAEEALETAAAILACHEAGVEPPVDRLEDRNNPPKIISSVGWLGTDYLGDKKHACQRALAEQTRWEVLVGHEGHKTLYGTVAAETEQEALTKARTCSNSSPDMVSVRPTPRSVASPRLAW